MTFGIDEQGNWREEKAKDVKEPSDTAPAGGRDRDDEGTKDASGMRARQQQQQQQQQHKTARDTDASSLSSSQDGTTTDNSRVVHRNQHHDNVGDDGDSDDGERPVNEFEIEIHEGEDAKGLADILRAAGYDVEIAELDHDGKYTIQNFDDDDYAETETNDGEQAGTKRKHRGNDQQQQPNGGHDEL